ncbi:hypothetical protein [Leptospira sp. id769339]|uniref:hypothetical protein n=1 Tax=Leptospira sp. id769339 TaxID=2864221 RepID=UPI00214B5E5F|nr:hypothetical protein [Leptospira sp. id769339]MCR1794919.1 hypothetical protein [Leptospira sp. id769339]
MAFGFSGDLNNQSEDYKYHDLGLRVYPEKAQDQNSPPPEWGCLIHPDEFRRIMFFGNESLISTRGSQIEDFQLKNWIDLTVRAFSQEIEWDIYPRLWRHRPLPNENGRYDLSPNGEIESYAEWEDLYDYDSTTSNYFQVKLRRKPLCRLHKWDLTFPWTGSSLIDLKDRAVPNYKTGILRAVFTRVPWSNLAPPITGIQAWRGLQGMNSLPGAYRIDYTTGYDHASRVPAELKEQILKLFCISVMSSFGEGVIGGVSNYSISVGVISESLGTSMSATSSLFGARIIQMTNELKEWWKRSKHRYSQIHLGSLG